MNLKLVLTAALAAGTLTAAAEGQTTAPQGAASAAPATAPAALPAPQAIPAKIAIIELQPVAAATNEGQNALAALQKKLESTRQKLENQKAEIDSLTKQLQAAPATMSDEEKAARARSIEAKQKQLQLDGDEFNTTANAEAQEAINKVITKLGPLVVKYVQQNGYTMLLDNPGAQQQQPGGLTLLWGGTDISQGVVDAYNAAYPAAAPVPSAPTAARPRPPAAKPAPKQ
ncbi:MAG TPA: OmpH family outer membrane protein [Acidobacteriaceae bacterium]|nr:OmpH family outer membrane protein [Acidobacteriaceae bacterium]